MDISEAEFQALVLDLVRTLGLQAYHTHDSRRSQPGFPDLVIVGRDGVLFRELKTMDGRVSVDQKYWIEILRAAGADVGIWRPSSWPDPITRELRALGRLTIQAPRKRPRVPAQRSRTW
jgi:hypothetical protein